MTWLTELFTQTCIRLAVISERAQWATLFPEQDSCRFSGSVLPVLLRQLSTKPLKKPVMPMLICASSLVFCSWLRERTGVWQSSYVWWISSVRRAGRVRLRPFLQQSAGRLLREGVRRGNHGLQCRGIWVRSFTVSLVPHPGQYSDFNVNANESKTI